MTFISPSPAPVLNDRALIEWARERGLLDTSSAIYSPEDLRHAATCFSCFGFVDLSTVEALPVEQAVR